MLAHYLLAAFIAGVVASPVEKAHQRRQNIPVGTIITSCTVPNTVAVAFDDGPYAYTDQIITALTNAGISATFFVNGANYASIYDYSSTILRMESEGHQIASHTWSHADLATLSAADITSQMTQLETALTSIIGKFPTYMRPPYFSTNDVALQTLGGLGYHVIQADIDTQDWANNDPSAIQNSVQIFEGGLNSGGSIVLAHDVHANTFSTLVPAMISAIQQRGLQGVTVGECLGDAPANWYRTSR